MIWEHSLNPVVLHIWGNFAIRWYSIAYLAGLFAGYLWFKMLVRNKFCTLTMTQLYDFMFYLAIGVMLGGRVGYLLFYDFQEFISDPFMIFRVWEGGMSFHGGFIGVLLAVIVYAKKIKIDIWRLAGMCAVVTPVGLFFGRLANFINGELWGKPTDGTWGVIFPAAPDMLPRHPTQLYEAFGEGALLFTVLYILFRKGVRFELMGPLFGIGYSFIRFFIEFVREPDEGIGYVIGETITTGHILSLGLLCFSLWLLWTVNRVRPTIPAASKTKK